MEKDLDDLAAGIIPHGMDFSLPPDGMVMVDADKINYNSNYREYWISKWDTELLEQFPTLITYVEALADEIVEAALTPLDEILFRASGLFNHKNVESKESF